MRNTVLRKQKDVNILFLFIVLAIRKKGKEGLVVVAVAIFEKFLIFFFLLLFFKLG